MTVATTIRMVVQRVAVAVAIVSIATGAGLVARDAHPGALGLLPTARVEPPQPAEEAKPKPSPKPTLEVFDRADRSPLPGATVWVRGTGGEAHTWEGTTDAQGRYAIIPPGQATRWIDVVVAPAGYVPGPLSTTSHERTITLGLERAEAVGGTVRDERGQPIEGARVFPRAYAPRFPLFSGEFHG
jgi:hypothetical protein